MKSANIRVELFSVKGLKPHVISIQSAVSLILSELLSVQDRSNSSSVCGPSSAFGKTENLPHPKPAPFTVRRQQISSLIHTSPSTAFIVSFHMFSTALERTRHPGYLSSLLCVLVISRSLKQTQMGDLKDVLLRSEMCCTVKDSLRFCGCRVDLLLSHFSARDEGRAGSAFILGPSRMH